MVDMPSTNLVLKSTLALLNMPFFRDTTMNCELLKCRFSMVPMFSVWDRSRAASTSSRMYSGAGLNSSMARIKDSATSDLWPPDSSPRESFHTPHRAILTSRPSSTVMFSGGSNLASAPGSRLPNIEPKSRFTWNLRENFNFNIVVLHLFVYGLRWILFKIK